MANALTALRMVCSAALIFIPPDSVGFGIVYLLAGVSDMLDGFIARRTGTASAFGAKLDSAADLLFIGVCLVRIVPALHLPLWALLWAAGIALLRGAACLIGFRRFKRLVLPHTTSEKTAGLAVFLMPVAARYVSAALCAAAACTMATAAAALLLIAMQKEKSAC